ncbi:hypothetical protein [Pleionea sediminis]|uniref:hypothetical protein n=1 Tax=Pleionea sediminis TaxID=2569479 RepID=UPI001186EC8B|nr:hypothetical protein [Pleionea sediminis]
MFIRKKISVFKLSVIALSAVLSHSSMAHEEPMEAGWCESGQIQVLGTFNLNERLLVKFRDEQDAVCANYNYRSCGQFDDDYGLATRIAGSMCHSFSSDEISGRSNGDHRTVRPIFHGPVTIMNAQSAHHSIYTLSQGLHFSCGYCEADGVAVEAEVEVEVEQAPAEFE